mgnify:CR=1 FL=1
MKTVIDIIPQMKTGTGFFSAFVDPCWAEDYETPAQLDMFYAMTYGHKHPAPILDMFVNEDTGEIDNDDVAVIASMLYQLRGHEWEKLYATLKAEYEPLDNTTVYERVRENRAISAANGNTRTLNTQTANSGTGSVTSSGSGSGNTANHRFGFDSAQAVGETTGSDSSTTQSTTGTTTSNTINDTGTITDAGNNSSSDSFQRIYEKHGNIGTMTYDQLIKGTIEAWKWSFIIQIMEDISNLTSLSVY